MRLRLPFDGSYEISTKYGENGHMAIDYACPSGTKILAAHSGVLSYENTDLGGRVAMVTGAECYTRYCHLMAYLVPNGKQVDAGDAIALSDNTGKPYDPITAPGGTTGSHLHWECHTPDGVFVNPLTFEINEGVQTMESLYSVSYQNPSLSKADVDALVDAGVTRIKMMIYPDTKLTMLPSWMEVVARPYLNDRDNEWIMQGAAGCDRWWSEVFLMLLANPNIKYVEGPNEQPHFTIEQLSSIDAFAVRQAYHCNQVGKRAVIYNFSTGNPEMWHWQYLLKGLAAPNVILGLHEYRMQTAVWEPAAEDTWHIGRFIRSADAIKGFGGVVPDLMFGECNIDLRGGADSDGWLAVEGMTPEKGLERLLDAEQVYLTSGYKVLGMYPFVTKPYGWASFDMETLNPLLLANIKARKQPAPHEGLPTDETTSDPAIMSEKIRWWSEESQRQYEAGNVARANNIRLSNIQLCYRLENLLKAA